MEGSIGQCPRATRRLRGEQQSGEGGARGRWVFLLVGIILIVLGASLVASAACDLTPPSGVQASTNRADRIVVSWQAVPGAAQYRVERRAPSSSTYVEIAQTTSLSYEDQTAGCGTYRYRVFACGQTCCSEASRIVSGRKGTPAAPVIQAAEGASTTCVLVTWNSVPGAAHYEVYRARTERGSYSRLGTTESTEFCDTTAQACRTYWYRVRAVSPCSYRSVYSNKDSGQRASLPAPENVEVTRGLNGVIRVSWSAVLGATSYEVYRGVCGGAFARVATATRTDHEDRSVQSCQCYVYYVRALPCGLQSDPVEGIALTIPGTPIGLTATQARCDGICVSWTAVFCAAYYEVEWSSSATGPWTRLDGAVDAAGAARVSVPPVAACDSAVSHCTSRWYRVRACNAVGCSSWSAPVQGHRACLPPAPANVVATDDDCYHVKITWNEVPGATEYRVEYAPNREAEPVLLCTTTELKCVDAVHPGGWYRVCAVGPCGASCSEWIPGYRKTGCPDVWCDKLENADTWTLTGLWHLSSREYCSATNALWFGNEGSGSYGLHAPSEVMARRPDAAAARVGGVSGTAMSPLIAAVGGSCMNLTFSSWREVEYATDGSFDRTVVEVRFGSGPWVVKWQKDSHDASARGWFLVEIPLTVPADASSMRVRFTFDSVDGAYNDYRGWFIDDVCIKPCDLTARSEPAFELPETPASLVAVCLPNVIRDIHTARFSVGGAWADAVRVEVYDLAGRLVYAAESEDAEIVWHTESLVGDYLANGVYLYRMWARVGGLWQSCVEAGKVVILR